MTCDSTLPWRLGLGLAEWSRTRDRTVRTVRYYLPLSACTKFLPRLNEPGYVAGTAWNELTLYALRFIGCRRRWEERRRPESCEGIVIEEPAARSSTSSPNLDVMV